jgi:hypothetical protein
VRPAKPFARGNRSPTSNPSRTASARCSRVASTQSCAARARARRSSVEEIDINRRQDLLDDARLHLERARIEQRRARLEAQSLERSREQLAFTLQQGGTRQQGTLAVLGEQIAAANAKVTQALAKAQDLQPS